MKNKVLYLACGLNMAVISTAHAAGFALMEQSASGMGNAYAGAAAIAEDASTIFFNPAGMTYIDGTQAAGAIHLINPNVEFNDNGSVKAAGAPAKGDEGPNAGDLAIIPNLYFMTELTPDVKVGIGLSAPFGLKTEFGDQWVGRFQADKSDLKTININPSVAFKVNDQLSLGFGVSAMWAEASLTRQVNRVFSPESNVKVKGDDWGYGFNLGAMYQATTDTRFGVAYRSKVEQRLEGKAKFGAALSAGNGNVKTDLTLPENLSISVFSRLNNTWDLMGDVTWTRWSQFKDLDITYNNGTPFSFTPENWSNTMRYSVGVNYHVNDTLKLRAGLAYDQEAISNEFRTARIPGNDRKWLSLGVGWKFSPTSKLDVGYAHLFVSDAKIDDDQTSATDGFNGRLRGDFKSSADVISLQFTQNF